jgi:hypothetical protein
MLFSEAINKAKTFAEAEKNGDVPCAQASPAAFTPKMVGEDEEEDDDDEEVEISSNPRYS